MFLPPNLIDVRFVLIVHRSLIDYHSDQDSQCANAAYPSSLAGTNIQMSMSRVGNCYDNAVAESFFKTLKVELIYQNHFQNKHEAKSSISDYIEKFYNTNRRHKHLDNMNILEYQKLQSKNWIKYYQR